jgi:hypothetical protein
MTEEINKKNIYQLVNLPVKYIENEWPHAKLTRKLKSLIVSDPNMVVEIVEGSMWLSDQILTEEKRWCYFLYCINHKSFLSKEITKKRGNI